MLTSTVLLVTLACFFSFLVCANLIKIICVLYSISLLLGHCHQRSDFCLVEIYNISVYQVFLFKGPLSLGFYLALPVYCFFDSKIFYINFCSDLFSGVYGPCHTLYESLEVKHIMNDTLG